MENKQFDGENFEQRPGNEQNSLDKLKVLLKEYEESEWAPWVQWAQEQIVIVGKQVLDNIPAFDRGTDWSDISNALAYYSFEAAVAEIDQLIIDGQFPAPAQKVKKAMIAKAQEILDDLETSQNKESVQDPEDNNSGAELTQTVNQEDQESHPNVYEMSVRDIHKTLGELIRESADLQTAQASLNADEARNLEILQHEFQGLEKAFGVFYSTEKPAQPEGVMDWVDKLYALNTQTFKEVMAAYPNLVQTFEILLQGVDNQFLQELGIRRERVEGSMYDEHLHNLDMVLPTQDSNPFTVLRVTKQGFRRAEDGFQLRKPNVVVAGAPR